MADFDDHEDEPPPAPEIVSEPEPVPSAEEPR